MAIPLLSKGRWTLSLNQSITEAMPYSDSVIVMMKIVRRR